MIKILLYTNKLIRPPFCSLGESGQIINRFDDYKQKMACFDPLLVMQWRIRRCCTGNPSMSRGRGEVTMQRWVKEEQPSTSKTHPRSLSSLSLLVMGDCFAVDAQMACELALFFFHGCPLGLFHHRTGKEAYIEGGVDRWRRRSTAMFFCWLFDLCHVFLFWIVKGAHKVGLTKKKA